MAGELVVANDQLQVGDLVMGPSTDYCWVDSIPDWYGYDGVRTADVPRMASHGVRGGRDLLGIKTISASVLVKAETQALLETRVNDFMAAWAPTDVDVPIVAQFLGAKRRRYGRPRRAMPTTSRMTRKGDTCEYTTVIAWQFDALDPFIYSDEEHTANAGLPVEGGFVVPFTPPFTLGASTSGVAGCYNAGNVNAEWTARLDGPLTDPALLHEESGYYLSFTEHGGLTLLTGEYLLLDTYTRSALLNGTADRRRNLAFYSTWFTLRPGVNSIDFVASGGSGTLTMYWRDAYL